MSDHNSTTKRQSSVSKRDARISALLLLGIAIVSLVGCIHMYLKGSFLESGSAFNAEMVHDMRVIIKVAAFLESV
jgi:hypothetical protein